MHILFSDSMIVGIRKVFWCIFIFIFITGCGSTPTSESRSKSVKIVFWNTMNQNELDILRPLISDFTAKNPAYTISMEPIPFNFARSKFEQGIKAGVSPDIFRADRFWLNGFVKAGLIEPLDYEILHDEIEDLLPVAREVVTSDSKIWALPHAVDCLSLYYNKSHFKEAGLPPPPNLDNFKKIAKDLTNSGRGRYGFFMNPDAWWFEPFLLGFGGQYFDKTGNLILNSDETLKSLHFLLELKDTEHSLPPVNLRTNAYSLMMQSFKMGQVSMMFNGPWAIRDALSGPAFKDSSDNLGIAPIPGGPSGRFSPMGCQSYVIPMGVKNKKEVLLFMKFLCSAEVESALSKHNYGIPARKSLFSDPELKNDPYLGPFINQLQTLKILETSFDRVKLYTDITDHLVKILNGDLSPEDSLKDLTSLWNKKK